MNVRNGAFCLAIMIAFGAPAVARPFELTDMRRVVDISNPVLSPNGAQIAAVVARVNWSQDRRDDSLVLFDVASGAQRTLTRDREGVSSPLWSPSGDRIAFIADDADGTAQIYAMPMAGGDAVQVTKSHDDVEQFAWRPDGARIAFVTRDVPDNDSSTTHLDAFDVGDNDYMIKSSSPPSHLWLAAPDGSWSKRLTSGTWSISSLDGGAGSGFSWSPDGRTIAITRLPNAVYGDSDPATVALVDAKTGATRDVPGQRAFDVGPEYSPDGTRLAVQWYRHGTFNSDASLVAMPVRGGAGRLLMPAVDRNIDWYRWQPAAGGGLYASGDDGPRVSLWFASSSGSVRKVDLGDVVFGNDADVASNGAVAFVGTTPRDPVELYYLSSAGARPRKLTALNAPIASLTLGAMREITWKGPNGFAEDGILTTPPGFSPSRRYPMVVNVHGGPQGADGLAFDELDQLLAAGGFVVFQPNYRGSTNLGDAYQHAIYRDGGDGPGKDVMAGVAAVERLGFVDSTRLSVSGWSYGGYMTSWLSGHYPVWKAAIEGAALDYYPLDYTIAWYQRGDAQDFFGGGPYDPKTAAMWIEQSPLTYAKYVKAPTLILADTGDANVPIVNSYMMYHALADYGVTVQFVAYPVQSHFPDDPVLVSDVYRRWVEWLTKYAH
ncbi:MAG TPA: S9 family peptidase [Candidatus Eremiobacteraceae bacterium]|nr:S9 family peptidase [Candidatus Eremiobacteraceae bacterium]